MSSILKVSSLSLLVATFAHAIATFDFKTTKHEKRSLVERGGVVYKVFEHAATEARIEFAVDFGICERTPRVKQYSGYVSVDEKLLMNGVPEYEALSYAWGSADEPSVVQVGTSEQALLPITRNLDIALRHLRHVKQSQMIWIDALCIDQASTDEKNHQVAAMGEIYSNAECVTIWLGTEQDRSDEAFDLIKHVADTIEVNYQMLTMTPSENCHELERHFANPRHVLPYQDGELDLVHQIYDRPYFKRVWIRQELALATRAVVRCGKKIIEFSDFRKAVTCFMIKSFKVNGLSDGLLAAFNKTRLQIYYMCTVVANCCTWKQLRLYLGDAQCQDPRDRIYAMLALLRDSERRLGFKPDYSTTTEDLYTDVARSVIIQNQSLGLLDSCDLTSRALNVPSWAPDWTSPPPLSTLNIQWSACAWITSEIRIVDNRRLRVAGIPVSPVKEIIAANLGLNSSTEEGCQSLVNILRRLKPTAEELSARCGTSRAWVQMLCSIIASFRYAESSRPPNPLLPRFEQFVDLVETICFTDITTTELRQRKDLRLNKILPIFRHAWLGFTFFKCYDAYIGLAFPGVQKGDLVSVLFNSQYPVLLRSCPGPLLDGPKAWEVVSVAMVADLMEGEAIYGCNALSHRQAVRCEKEVFDMSGLIDSQQLGMYNYETGELSQEPAEILEEMGIKVESYQDYPHRLEVLPETLRAAGVRMREFLLV
ncbi:heterokaryon incompatibility protein-domain-containing protein [Ampelomyces quisqualis]|uniref:Heterokaryon incompatibility protein-domain-containing protein n=1 Tax=Ampelomyces quisqualis TaxID=50730 RepID=A0A6A5R0I8_AMPQU|nr:heterokaryon incompatibility protein-domain-containing protein [Ampelomyces quisqualis]